MADKSGTLVSLSKKQKILLDGLLPHHQIVLLAHLSGTVLRDEIWITLTDTIVLDTMECYADYLYCDVSLSASLANLQSRMKAFDNSDQNIHHVVPRSRGGTNKKENTIERNKQRHERYHMRTSNMHFGEQLRDVLLYDGYMLHDSMYHILFDLTKLSPQKLFIPWVIPRKW